MSDEGNQSIPASGKDQLSMWFGLSYASWLTIPRVLMEQMPDDWQERMANLLREYEDEFPGAASEEFGTTRVQLVKKGKLSKMDRDLINYRHPSREFLDKVRKAQQ